MKSMYIVYSENQMQRKHLEGEFMQNSGLFVVPFSHVKTLHDLIDKTCLQYFKKGESIFIEKLKNFILGITSFSFSFPLWHEILSELKQKSLLAEGYRNYLVQMNRFFMEENIDKQLFNINYPSYEKIDEDNLEKALRSCKSLSDIDMDEQQDNFSTFQQVEKLLKIPQSHTEFQDKFSVYESEKTNDQSIKRHIKKYSVQIQPSHKISGQPLCFLDSNSPIKHLQYDFQAQLIKFSQSAIQFQGQIPKVSRKSKLPSYIKVSNEVDDFINSFKKQRCSPVAQMIIQDQSFNKIVKKEKKTQRQRKKLQDDLYQNTKSVKSKQYNRNIKTILMNKKVNDKKKTGFQGQRSRISGVVGAYQLRKVSSEVFHFEEQANLKLFKSAGKSVINGKK